MSASEQHSQTNGLANGHSKKPWIMNAFAMMAPGHLAPGLWRHPSHQPQNLKTWISLAKLLDEANGFHGIFFADVLGLYTTYKTSAAPSLTSGAQVPHQDISLYISALAAATSHLCFGVTASTTYENPYSLARRLSTLDHLTDGRVGWNIVTTYLESAARSFGFDELVEHDERYVRAGEFMEVVYKLWEGSWKDGAVVGQWGQGRDGKGIWSNPESVREIGHDGKYYKCAGPHLVDPSPQRTPFLLQAGASKAGQDFASSHAEAMFLPGMVIEKVRATVDSVRAQLADKGRAADSVKFIAGMFVCVGETDEAAQAKFQEYLSYADLEGTAALFGGWTGTDLSTFSDDEDFSFTGPPAIQSLISNWTKTVPGLEGQKWTKRYVLQHMAICGAHPRAIGSAKTVADIMESWVEEAGVDGFNLSYAVPTETFGDMIKYLWPELRRRGVLADLTKPEGTMRANYLQDGLGPKAREGHPSRQFRWI